MADKSADVSGVSGAERAAILLLTLGEQDAAELLRHMDPREVQRVGQAMAGLKNVPREKIQAVLTTFVKGVENKGPSGADATEYMKRVLVSSLGKQRADLLLERISSGLEPGAGIEHLKWLDPKSVAQLIGEEHPQVIAILLAHLDPDQAGAVCSLLPPEIRTDILIRVATLDEVPQSALNELGDVIEKRAAQSNSSPQRRLGGARLTANMMNAMPRDMQAEVLTQIEQSDVDLHQKIKDQMFIFENLLQIDDRGIQTILREADSGQLSIALRGADPEVQDKILRNMSKRAAEILKDDMETRGPVKVSEVEAAQKEIIAIAQRLAEEGTIMIGGGGGEYV
ncbi:MAG: flagellar motor switch protein FliG [Steroidobacteraceae bacterium]